VIAGHRPVRRDQYGPPAATLTDNGSVYTSRFTDARRVPVVDSDGHLLGVVGVTDDLAGFCGTS
jgi:CBS-domain-containing membrane protein